MSIRFDQIDRNANISFDFYFSFAAFRCVIYLFRVFFLFASILYVCLTIFNASTKHLLSCYLHWNLFVYQSLKSFGNCDTSERHFKRQKENVCSNQQNISLRKRREAEMEKLLSHFLCAIDKSITFSMCRIKHSIRKRNLSSFIIFFAFIFSFSVWRIFWLSSSFSDSFVDHLCAFRVTIKCVYAKKERSWAQATISDKMTSSSSWPFWVRLSVCTLSRLVSSEIINNNKK